MYKLITYFKFVSTNYFLKGRNKDIVSINTQKSIGKLIGNVKSIHNNYLILEVKLKFNNGDGICFFDKHGKLKGTKINKVEILSAEACQKIYPDNINEIEIGTQLFRNFDVAFNKQFTKSGDSIFKNEKVTIDLVPSLFFPISELNELRRKTLELLETERSKNYKKATFQIAKNEMLYPQKFIDYKGNVLNKLAIQFYKRHGIKHVENAFEAQTDFSGKEIMIIKHCIKYQVRACEKYEKNPEKLSEPLFLEDNNRKYKLDFDCDNCLMKVIFTD